MRMPRANLTVNQVQIATEDAARCDRLMRALDAWQ